MGDRACRHRGWWRWAPQAAWAAQPGAGRTTSGTATVFFPNPVAQLRDENLTDQKDADYALLEACL